jgi:hypothetical protein
VPAVVQDNPALNAAWANDRYVCEASGLEPRPLPNTHGEGSFSVNGYGWTEAEARVQALNLCTGTSQARSCQAGPCSVESQDDPNNEDPGIPIPQPSGPSSQDVLSCAGKGGITVEILEGKTIYDGVALLRRHSDFLGAIVLQADVPSDQPRPGSFRSVSKSDFELDIQWTGSSWEEMTSDHSTARLYVDAFGLQLAQTVNCAWKKPDQTPVGSPSHGGWGGGHH